MKKRVNEKELKKFLKDKLKKKFQDFLCLGTWLEEAQDSFDDGKEFELSDYYSKDNNPHLFNTELEIKDMTKKVLIDLVDILKEEVESLTEDCVNLGAENLELCGRLKLINEKLRGLKC